MSDAPPRPEQHPAWIYGLVATLAVLWGFLWFTVAGHDDCHITYWAVHTLVEHGEITNYNGEAVEQSSSLLHTLLLAFGAKLTPWSIPTLGYLLGVAAAWWSTFRLGRFVDRRSSKPLLVTAVFALNAPWLYWALGGLETTLVGLLLLELTICMYRIGHGETQGSSPATMAAFVGLALVRPEGFFVALAALVAVALSSRKLAPELGWRPWLVPAAVGLVAFIAVTAWRHAYFDAFFPQPVGVKFDGAVGGSDVGDGASYLAKALMRPGIGAPALVAAIGAGLAIKRGARPNMAFVAPFFVAGAYLGFTFVVGGDWMEASRFVAHAWPPLALLFALALEEFDAERSRKAVAGLAALATLLGAPWIAGRESAGRTLPKLLEEDALFAELAGDEFTWTERVRLGNGRDILLYPELETTLATLIAETGDERKPRVLSGQAGMLMYHLARPHYGEFIYIDRYGLSSRHLSELAQACKLPTGHFGLHVYTETFFECIDAQGRDDLRPDMVFDIRGTHIKSVKKRKMPIVHEQKGRLTSWTGDGKAGALFKYTVNAYMFIAVDPRFKKATRTAVPERSFDWNAYRNEKLAP